MADRLHEVLAQIPAPQADGPAQLEAKLALAAEAFGRHRTTSFAERSVKMIKAAEVLEAGADRFADCITAEMGKPLAAARGEVLKCAFVCRYYAEQAEAMLRDEPAASGFMHAFTRFQPLGTVLAIMPWNYPFWQVFRFAAPALMAGNTALLKHASNVPRCAALIEEIFLHAGFEKGVFQSVYARSSAIAPAIADDRIAAVTLTGSEGAGKAVGSAAGAAIKKVVLELGGSDPFIIMPSAELEKALPAAVSARMMNNGQSCIGAKRILLHASIYDKALAELEARIAALRVGDPFDPATDIGPLALPEFADELEDQVARAVVAGGRLLVGGKRSPRGPAFYEPTLLVDVPRTAAIAREEFFGPVMMVFRFETIEEAISLANETPFGLGSSVWTAERDEQLRFAHEIDAGQVFINAITASDPRIPFGGIKRSGIGRELGVYGIREFTNIKTVAFGGC